MAKVTEQTKARYLIELNSEEKETIGRDKELRDRPSRPVTRADILQRLVEGWVAERKHKHTEIRAGQLEAGYAVLSVADQARVKGIIKGL